MTDELDPQQEQLLAERLRKLDDGDASFDDCANDLTQDQADRLARAQRMLRLLDQARGNATWEPDSAAPSDRQQAKQSTAGLIHDETLGQPETLRAHDHGGTLQRIGRFEIIRELGRGGFGVVLLARDPKLDREIALKVPRAETLLSTDAQMRFEREAQAATILGHPAILPIYEAGSSGIVRYIAFGYCSGESLAAWFRQRTCQVPPELSARIVARLAEATQHAHSRGVVHRDLKPGNILLDTGDNASSMTDDELVEALRISDFGLSRLADGNSDVTRTGAILGTPAYMSPEQARGDNSVGEPADIYALGAILYELLAGAAPLSKPTELATLRAIELEQPLGIRNQSPTVPKDLEAICLKCLEKDAGDRYASAQELQDDLQRYLSQQPVIARRASLQGRFARWCRRNPIVAGALTTAIVALVVGLVFSVAFAVRAESARQFADDQQELANTKSSEALTQARLARQAVDQLQRAIADEPAIHAQGMEKFKQKLAAASNDYYALLRNERPNDREVLKEYLDTLKGLAYLQQLLGEHESSAAMWQQAAEIYTKEFPMDVADWAAAESKHAEVLLLDGKIDEAVDMSTRVVNRLQTAATNADPGESDKIAKNLIAQLVGLAQNISTKGDIGKANQIADQAIELVSEVTGELPLDWPAHRIWARALRCKCEIAWKLGDHDSIDSLVPVSIDIYRQIMQDSPERTSEALDSMASMHQVMGTSLKMRGRWEESLRQFECEAELQQQLMKRHPDMPMLHFNWSNHVHRYGQALLAAGKLDEAESQVAPHLISLIEQQDKYPKAAFLLKLSEVECRELMATIYQQQKRPEESLEQLDLAISVAAKLCESAQVPIGLRALWGNLYARKGEVLLKTGEPQRAVEQLAQGIQILEPLADQPGGQEVKSFLDDARKLLARAESSQRKQL